jgi:hypothetical protein
MCNHLNISSLSLSQAQTVRIAIDSHDDDSRFNAMETILNNSPNLKQVTFLQTFIPYDLENLFKEYPKIIFNKSL